MFTCWSSHTVIGSSAATTGYPGPDGGLRDAPIIVPSDVHPDVHASLLISPNATPVIMMHRQLIGTPAEGPLLVRVREAIHSGQDGFYLWMGGKS
jgi:hypothetical protein